MPPVPPVAPTPYQPAVPPVQQVYVQYAPSPTNGLAVAGLILAIVGLFLALIPFVGFFLFWVPSILGIVFGFIGLSTATRLGGLHRMSALWAVILGFAAGPLGLLFTLVIAALGRAVSGS
ncbi:hypothetical protein BH11ACT4_BH11ACT4_05110 [soil metagenome]